MKNLKSSDIARIVIPCLYWLVDMNRASIGDYKGKWDMHYLNDHAF